MTTTPTFADLPHDARLAFLYALDAIGAESAGYHGRYVSVRVPRVEGSTWAGIQATDRVAAAHGLVRDDDGTYFPLGSDNPAEHLRHGIPWKYPNQAPGFWFTLNYRPADPVAVVEAPVVEPQEAEPDVCSCGASLQTGADGQPECPVCWRGPEDGFEALYAEAAQEAAQAAQQPAGEAIDASPDIRVERHGSVALVRPQTAAAREWLAEHVEAGAQWFGGALAVEPRYLDALVEGLFEDGFTVVGER